MICLKVYYPDGGLLFRSCIHNHHYHNGMWPCFVKEEEKDHQKDHQEDLGH